MSIEMIGTERERSRSNRGFTLVEAMLSAVLLTIMASAISMLYISGLQALDVNADQAMLAGKLRSRMEYLLSLPFDTVSDGTENVTVKAQNYTINWTVKLVDMDGDAVPETNAKRITVSLAGVASHTLTTLIVDHEGRVGKL
jgi:Tfp pilus assembly protein PilE